MISRTVVVWIVVLASFLVLAIIIGRVLTPASYFDPEIEACAQQIKTSSQISTATKGDYATEIDCPTKEHTLSGSEEEIYDGLITDIAECAKLWQTDGLLFEEDNKIYCHVCSLATVETDEELTGFSEHLSETSFEGELQTGTKKDDLQNQELAQPAIENGQYATIFVYARGEKAVTALGQNLFPVDYATRGAAATGIVAVGAGLVAGTASVVGGTACVLSGVCIVIGAVTVASVVASTYFLDNPPEFFSTILLREWTPETVQQIGCEIKA